MLIPRKKAPQLSVSTLNHGQFDLNEQTSERGTLISFYRGLHCGICPASLANLESLQGEFESRGVGILALSTDTRERAQLMAEKVKNDKMRIGYGLSLEDARAWGLFLSAGRGKTSMGVEEPDLFSEPAVFLVTPEQTLYFSVVQTMPFVRPHFKDFVSALDFVIAKNYPARGEYDGEIQSDRKGRQ